MINQRILYLKNLICFKIVLYGIIILLCHIYGSYLHNHLEILNTKIQKNKKHLEILQNKYNSAIELLNNSALQKKIKPILQQKLSQPYDRNKLIEHYTNVSKKWKLHNFNVSVSSPYQLQPNNYYNRKISIENRDVFLSFYIPEFSDLMPLITDIYNLTPQYTTIEKLQALYNTPMCLNNVHDICTDKLYIFVKMKLNLSQVKKFDIQSKP
ncbi:hypothetical protein OTSGILL_0778 [Orientia tsutsugamushi str. Gilliam]|uniref:Uncharacterized protein n=1 Tax=Orientia tsutsugamushi str. Gilliam TaxID=1359184 RepID=A0A0F3MCA9_ORITS|nr:hypothetical protein OTSGILL_0778 [Orientia tsutsugamushi str. Gilliam]SPR11454.1 Uncharacterised protein [Orientia tsutsugamushi str. Gilliam]